MGTKKNHLNETVPLSTQNICLNCGVRKCLEFYAQKFRLSKPVASHRKANEFVNLKVVKELRVVFGMGTSPVLRTNLEIFL